MTYEELQDGMVKNKLFTMYRDADAYYKIPERAYHNVTHAQRVVETVLLLEDSPSSELVLAAKWHDAVYIPGSSVNEIASADALMNTYKVYRTTLVSDPNGNHQFIQ